MGRFYAVLGNTVAASLANTCVWFAVTFWVYLQTRSVIATSVMAGIYTVSVAGSGFFLGSLVDRYPKRRVMLVSSAGTLALYTLALGAFVGAPQGTFADPSSVRLWLFVTLTLVGAIVGNARGIALATLVTVLVPEAGRDRANGLVGTANGVAFLVASILSGLAIGFLGIGGMLVGAIGLTLLVILHLWTLAIPDHPEGVSREAGTGAAGVDLRGTIRAIRLVPGLFGLIFFHTFNNFLGGVFMSLMDAYGLSLVSVQVWGALWGVLSLAFIVGGLLVARRGLGANPLRTLFLANIAMWSVCVVFTLQSSIVLLTAGLFVWLCLIPAVEAAEQTILQRVVPPARQGRVFGFAQSVEQSASPITAFAIGPIAELVFVPFMTTGAGVTLLGGWFGTGPDRGLALLFTVAGAIGLVVTLLAMRTVAYRVLSAQYRGLQAPDRQPQAPVGLAVSEAAAA
ncbi:MAG: Multidrug and toxin extrusion (MATE) family efflux pump YdhE/NorM, homolog [uncultured Chloroflexi bacterium]|uniref:Multidrug and toxin extrusion (MATE) family efflux pump YdhE/NorM, homolog n=1 Tax=uncultured Chloroflexota bacterium TaxID=166587 RepID=A0A6J4KF21_9CHLR|nr:MAG: Multidrug and toxin extrusion (MATE) family efflux pump YdhE/NorM, homolog [uncultured Chloroflexota bacterium]